MTPADTIAALRELQKMGWRLKVWGPWHSDNEQGVELFFPDGGVGSVRYVYEDKPIFERDKALIQGWLVACLEARGLTPEVHVLHNDDDSRDVYFEYQVQLWERNGAFGPKTPEWYRSRLVALLQACLALPDARAARGGEV